MRFFGEIGYGVAQKVGPGVWEDQITELSYYGDVMQNTITSRNAGSILTENTFQTTISVVADAYALENFTAIKYIKWAGTYWTVTSVGVQRPRLHLMLGEVYDGPKGASANTP